MVKCGDGMFEKDLWCDRSRSKAGVLDNVVARARTTKILRMLAWA